MDFHCMRREAVSYLDNSPRRVQDLVRQFFDSMDTNGDRSVDFYEIHDFLQGKTFLTRLLDGELFYALDEDGDGSLDFYEFITLFYIIFTMFRCNVCRNRMLGQPHFTCVVCFTSANVNSSTYDICGSCYDRGYVNHRHHQLVNYHAFILDGAGRGHGQNTTAMRSGNRPRLGPGIPAGRGLGPPRFSQPPGHLQRQNMYPVGEYRHYGSGGPSDRPRSVQRSNSTRETVGEIINFLDGAHTVYQVASAAALCTIM